MLRTLRGVLGTALAWALPWALAGGAALTVLGYVSFARAFAPPTNVLVDMFLNGALVSGVIGAMSGAAFASIVALTERRATFVSLSIGRMLGWGAVGSGAVALALTAVASIATGRAPWSLLPLVGVSVALGAASSAGMLWLARRAHDDPSTPALGSGASSMPPIARERQPVRRGTT